MVGVIESRKETAENALPVVNELGKLLIHPKLERWCQKNNPEKGTQLFHAAQKFSEALREAQAEMGSQAGLKPEDLPKIHFPRFIQLDWRTSPNR